MKRMEANYCDIRISRRVGQPFCAFATQAMRLWTYSGSRNLVAHTERIEKGKNVSHRACSAVRKPEMDSY